MWAFRSQWRLFPQSGCHCCHCGPQSHPCPCSPAPDSAPSSLAPGPGFDGTSGCSSAAAVSGSELPAFREVQLISKHGGTIFSAGD